jgi:hypothetical protein
LDLRYDSRFAGKPLEMAMKTKLADGSRDFDFLVGSWHVRHRRLDGRLLGSTSWESFEGSSRAFALMDGRANVDDNVIELPAGAYRAMSVRAYDAASATWNIWWIDGRTATIDAPVRGGFVNGVGMFECDDMLDGRPIRVRFTWSAITKSRAHWEQAFSPDAGRTWETNWTMDFERVGPA